MVSISYRGALLLMPVSASYSLVAAAQEKQKRHEALEERARRYGVTKGNRLGTAAGPERGDTEESPATREARLERQQAKVHVEVRRAQAIPV